VSYVYVESNSDGYGNHLWTVGFYDPNGKWHAESDWPNSEEASARTAWLNGRNPYPSLDEALNSGDGVYRP